jgi:oligoendopeptidase F
MMDFKSLPRDARTVLDCSWEQVEPYYRDLLERPLTSENVSSWLADWSQLSSLLFESNQRHYVAITVNTMDGQAKAGYDAFLDRVYPPSQQAENQLKEKLLASGLEPENYEIPLRCLRTEAEIFHPDNLLLLAEELKLSSEYDEIVGAQAVDWNGQSLTLMQLFPVFLQPDRQERQRAWQMAARRQLVDRQVINELWVKLMDVRGKLAKNAHQLDYRDYRWKQLLRLDYTPEDCMTFHDAIEKVVVPAAQRVYESRRQRLGVQSVRPWDQYVDTRGRPALKPFEQVEDLERKVAAMFQQVDPELAAYFETMRQEKLLDLENRKGKAPGGYCTDFPSAQRSFIFMNSVGIHDDVQTLVHEGGHAFHNFESSRLPYLQQRQVGMEFGEVASMGMELLASPYLTADKGGFYTLAEAGRAMIENLETIICFWAYMAVGDAFQHWAYQNHAAASDPSNCDAAWSELFDRFMVGVDWSGLEAEKATGWQRKLHIMEVPFYYVEYGLAQAGALQIWRNAMNDQASAVKAYRAALRLGGTRSIPELFAAAGIRFAFDRQTIQELVDLCETMIERYEALS